MTKLVLPVCWTEQTRTRCLHGYNTTVYRVIFGARKISDLVEHCEVWQYKHLFIIVFPCNISLIFIHWIMPDINYIKLTRKCAAVELASSSCELQNLWAHLKRGAFDNPLKISVLQLPLTPAKIMPSSRIFYSIISMYIKLTARSTQRCNESSTICKQRS